MKYPHPKHFQTISSGILLAATLAVAVFAPAAVQAAPQDLLGLMPEQAALAVVAPSVGTLHDALEGLLNQPSMEPYRASLGLEDKSLAQLAADELDLGEVGSFAEVTKALGVAADKPAALFFSPEGLLLALPEGEAATMEKHLADMASGAFAETDLGGGLTGKFDSAEPIGYFFANGLALVSDREEWLKSAAARTASPAPVVFGSDQFPVQQADEVLLYGNLSNPNLEGGLKTLGAEDALPAIGVLKERFDEFVLGIRQAGNGVQLRLAAHDHLGDAVTDAPPLQLPALLGKEAVAVAGLRITPGLIDFLLRAAAASMPDNAKQITSVGQLWTKQLGNEIAVAFYPGANGTVEFVGVLDAPVPIQAIGLRALLGFPVQPAETYNNAQIFTSTEAMKGSTVYLAAAAKSVIATNRQDAVKPLIDGQAAGSPLPEAVAKQANHGFVFVNGAKGQAVLNDVFGTTVDKTGAAPADQIVTIEQHGTWAQLTLDAPDVALIAGMFAPKEEAPKEGAAPAAGEQAAPSEPAKDDKTDPA